MRKIGYLKDYAKLSDKFKEIFVECSTVIDKSGFMKIDWLLADYWIKVKDHSYSCHANTELFVKKIG